MSPEKQRKFFDIIVPSEKEILTSPINRKHEKAPELKEEKKKDKEDRGEAASKTLSKSSRKKISASHGRVLSIFSFLKFLPAKNSLALIFGGLVLVSAGLFLYFYLPRVQVKITPKVEVLNFDMDVLGELGFSSLNLEKNQIPVEIFSQEKELSQEFQSTGKTLTDSRARGVITVYNNYSSSSQALVKTTRFISQNGKIFRSVATVVIPGATNNGGKIIPSSKDVEVIAEETGGEYNIGPSNFSIPGFKGTPKFMSFYGQSKDAMTGGANGQVNSVSQEDLDKALKTLTDQAKQAVESELKLKIPGNLKVLNEAQETKIIETKKPEVGSGGAKFTVTVKAMSRVLVFDENDVQKLMEEKMGKDLIPKEKEGLPRSSQINYTFNKFPDFDKGILDLKLKIKQKIVWKIDQNALKLELVGKDEAGIRDVLSRNPAIDKAQVTLWPFWVKQAPKDPERIKIEL